MNPHRTYRISGFSFLEIMLAIAIIAIIAAMAIPSRTGAMTQQRVIETIMLVEPYKAQIVNHFVHNAGEFPEDNDAAGLPEPRKIIGNYLEKMEVRGGAMHLYLGQKLPQSLHHKIISIRPVFVRDSPDSPVSWICGLNQVPSGMTAAGMNLTDLDAMFLPGRCR